MEVKVQVGLDPNGGDRDLVDPFILPRHPPSPTYWVFREKVKPNPHVGAIFRLTGVTQKLPIHPSVPSRRDELGEDDPVSLRPLGSCRRTSPRILVGLVLSSVRIIPESSVRDRGPPVQYN